MSAENTGKNTGNLAPQWVKGQSGNPGGRPKANTALRAKCRELDDEMIERLRDLARSADSDAASVAAIKLLLAYGHGAPPTKPVDEEQGDAGDEGDTLTAEQVQALARARLAQEN